MALQFWVQRNRIFTVGVPQASHGNSTKSLMGGWIIWEIMYHVGRRKTTKVNLYHVTEFSVYSDQLAKIRQHWWNELTAHSFAKSPNNPQDSISQHSRLLQPAQLLQDPSINITSILTFNRHNGMEAAKIGLGLRLQSTQLSHLPKGHNPNTTPTTTTVRATSTTPKTSFITLFLLFPLVV